MCKSRTSLMGFIFYLPFFHFIPLFILILLILIPFKKLLSASKTHKNPPPSPRKLPIIGNLHRLGLNPHRTLLNLTQKHGPLVLIHLGSVPVLVASSAESAQEILKTHDAIFSSRPKLSIPDTLTYGSKDIAFAPYGEYWRKAKSIAVIRLLSGTRVRSYRQVREEETQIMIDSIGECCGSSIDLGELLKSLTNNIVCRVALGRKYEGVKFNDLLASFLYLLGAFSVGNYVPWLSWVDWLTGLKRRANKVAKELDDFLKGVIEEHINKRGEVVLHDEEDKGRDLVDILLDLQEENTSVQRDTVKAIILDIFSAGTDTTSVNIEWAMSELIKHPRVMKKLQQEARQIAKGRSKISEEDLEEMEYLKAVIKETLRLHPPVPLLVLRESTKYVKLMGYDIPAGTQVIINAWAIGRDPLIWEDAETFRPERFLKSDIDYKGNHFGLIPFGAGRRGCPGIQFAMAVNELVLANMVHKYDFTLPNEEEEVEMSEFTGIVVRRKSPLLVVANPRF